MFMASFVPGFILPDQVKSVGKRVLGTGNSMSKVPRYRGLGELRKLEEAGVA